ncbi:MAG: RNB domain-containing ribonuclease [Thermoanaerobaculia bacterium]|nr:RNB domain-containing ribonuclease [Thermoanaerobaculia bacterium]
MPRGRHHRSDLAAIARRAMLEKGLNPDFPPAALEQLDRIKEPGREKGPAIRDLRDLLWASIDNDDSRDLDQLSVAEERPGGAVRVLIAIADVDALVKKGTPLDDRAAQNTTSVYTSGGIFPMLPEKLSTDLTSLNPDEDRLSIVIEYFVNADGTLGDSNVFRALVNNKAKLAYDAVDAWRDGRGPMPPAMAAVPGVVEQIRLQEDVSQRLRRLRYAQGALDLQTIEARAVFDGEEIRDLTVDEQNQPRQLIEDFMIAANGVTARYLEEAGFAALRRIVRSPERWQRIVSVAAEHGFSLPDEPDSKALEEFLAARKKADPLRFPDLSLVIVKLMGSGEYVVELPGREPVGHFGLAVRDYTHSTAPNRRYPDVITQRLLKAALAQRPSPYSVSELNGLAVRCTEQEDAANKVERLLRKAAAALLLETRIGERFDGIVTGASEKGTWARIFRPPVEGKIVHGFEGLEVGDKVRVKLVATNVERGFIDFVRA